jgi:hypothetical protein
MLKWALIVVGVVAAALTALVATVWIVGAGIEREHSATSRIELHQPPAVVWAAITGHGAMTSWRTGVQSVERGEDQDGKPVWIEVSGFGPMALRVEESIEPHRYVLAIADEEQPFGGTWTYVVEPTASGCTVAITEDGFIDSIPFRFVAKHLMGYHGTLDQYLSDLAGKFGEAARPEHH